MKFFKKSKYIIINNSKTLEKFEDHFWNLQFQQINNCLETIFINKKQFYSEEQLWPYEQKLNEYKIYINSGNNPSINKNVFKTKIINYLMLAGKKQTSYKIYNNLFKSYIDLI